MGQELMGQTSFLRTTAGRTFVKAIAKASETFADSLSPVLVTNRETSLGDSATSENAVKPFYRDRLTISLMVPPHVDATPRIFGEIHYVTYFPSDPKWRCPAKFAEDRSPHESTVGN